MGDMNRRIRRMIGSFDIKQPGEKGVEEERMDVMSRMGQTTGKERARGLRQKWNGVF